MERKDEKNFGSTSALAKQHITAHLLNEHLYMFLSGSLANSNIRNKHILTSHKHELILLPDPFSKYVYAYVK